MEKRSWNQIRKEKLSEEINRQMIWGKNLMAVRFEIAPNSSIPIHEHESEQLTMVQNGRITLHFAEQADITLGLNEMLLIPSMVPHSASSGPEGCEIIDLFSPIRQDFIEGRPALSLNQRKLPLIKKTNRKIRKRFQKRNHILSYMDF